MFIFKFHGMGMIRIYVLTAHFYMYQAVHVSPTLPRPDKLVPYILILAIMVIGLQKFYTKTEVGLGLNDVY
jgi:hypothetical protein